MKNTLIILTTLSLLFLLNNPSYGQIAGSGNDLSSLLPLLEGEKPGDKKKTPTNPDHDVWPKCTPPADVSIQNDKDESILVWGKSGNQTDYEIEVFYEEDGKEIVENKITTKKSKYVIPKSFARTNKSYKVRIRKICYSQQGSIFYSDWVVMASVAPCDVSVTIVGNSYICPGGSVLTAVPDPAGNNFRYQWNTGSTAPNITVTDTLQYSVTVTDLGTGCTAVGSKQMYPIPQISVSPLTVDHCLYTDSTILTGLISPTNYNDSLNLNITWETSYYNTTEWNIINNDLPLGVTYLNQNTRQLNIIGGTTQYTPWYYRLRINLNCPFPNNKVCSNNVQLNFVECASNQCDAHVSPEVVTCPFGPVTFVATPGTTGTTYLWSTGQTSQSIVIDTFSTTTTYTVTVTCPDQTVAVKEANLVMIDNCGTRNPEVACDFTPVFYGYKLPNNILKLTFNPGNFLEFLESMHYNNVAYVYVEITGNSPGLDNDTRSQILYNRHTDNQLYWSHSFLNFANFDEYTIRLKVLDIEGNEINCSEESELIFDTSEEFPYCMVIGGMKYLETSENAITFSFADPENTDHFSQFLSTVGINETELNDYMNDKVSHIRLRLTALVDGIPFVREEVHSLPVMGNFQMRNLSKTFTNVPIGQHFTGKLKLIFTLKNNVGDTSCDSIDVTLGNAPSPTFVQCGEDMTNESNLSTIAYNGELIGPMFSINKLPLVILQVSQGTPSTGLYGQGFVSIPFFGIGGVLVNLNGIKINREKKVFEGTATAIQGTNQINLNNIPPILAGNICLPPPPEPSVYVNGIVPATGLDKYGFNPVTGINSITKTPYDVNGFNVDGIHEDTGQPYNSEGCTREGYVYNEDPNAPKVPCDPSGGAPPGLTAFLDSLYQTDFEATVQMVLDSLIAERTAGLQNCDSIRNLFNPDIIGSNPEHVFGPGDILKNDEMHLQFSEKPYSIPEYLGTRNSQMIAFENNHIELYECTKKNHEDNQWKQRLINLKEDPLFTQLVDWLKDELRNVSANELKAIKKPGTLKAWIASKINTYLVESKDLGIQYNKTFNPDLYNDATEVQTASVNQFFFSQEVKNTFVHSGSLDIEKAVEKVMASASMVSGTSVTVPIVKKIDKGNFSCDFIFTNFVFSSTNCDANIYVVVENKDDGKKLVFRGTNINFNGGGVDSLGSRLSLVNDVEIRLANTAKLKVHKGHNRTYLQWNCDGIQRINLNTTIEFCSSYVVGLESDMKTVAKDSILKFDVELGFEKWLEFTLRVKGKPFYIKKYPDFPISMDTLIVDYSGTRSYNMTPPLGYTHSFFDANTHRFENLWKGFYLKGLKINIPSSLFSKNDSTASEISVSALNCLIDDTGFSGIFEVATNLLDFSTGRLGSKNPSEPGGWQFSVNSFHLVFLHNTLAGGGLGGEILVPKLKHPFNYKGTLISNKILCLKIENTQTNQMPSLKGLTVTLKQNTYIQGIYDFEKKDWDIMANLCGDMVVSSDSGFLSKLQIPKITFQNFRIHNKKPRLSPGYWGMGDLDGAVGFNFKGFGMSLDSIRPYAGEAGSDTMYLGIFFGVQIADSMIVAKGGFDIISSYTVEDDVQKWNYGGLRLRHICIEGSYKELFSLSGCVEFFYSRDTFGDGWRGMLNIKLKFMEKTTPGTESASPSSSGGYGIEAVAIFGNINEHKYWSVDLIATGTPLFSAMGLNFTGLGGGLAKGMYPDTSRIPAVITEWDIETFLHSPLGTTLTGVVYLPDPNYGYEIKLITRFEIAKKEVGHGTGEIMVRLNSTGALEEIEIRAQATMIEKDILSNFPFKSGITTVLEDVSEMNVGKVNVGSALGSVNIPTALDNVNAAIKGIASFKMNFRTKEFKGTIAAFMTTGLAPGDKGPISGIGPRGELCFIDIYFGPKKWYIYAGEPAMDKRMGTHLKIGNVINIKMASYFCIGSIVPDFPPLPKEVAHLGRGLGVPAHIRNSGGGFVFGSALHIAINADAVVASADIQMGGGFDIMMRKYKDVGCINDDGNVEPIGINEYYAMGQLWAFLKGNVKVFGINIFKAGFAAALQFQAPNPTWVGGGLELNVYNMNVNVNFEAGDKCKFVSDDPADLLGIDLIESLDPINNLGEISGCENLVVNLALEDGDTHEVDFGDGNGMTPVTVRINWDSTGVFYKGYKIDCKVKQNGKKVTFIPENFFPSSDSILFYAKIDILLPTGAVFASQRKFIKYRAEKLVQYIPSTNVEYSYPTQGMVNYYKDELKSNIGYIKLISGQGYLFYNDQNIYARFTTPSGVSFNTKVAYESGNKTIEIKMDKNNFENGEYYRMDLLKSDPSDSDTGFETGEKPASGPVRSDNALYTLYFRVSQYNTLAEKVSAMDAAFNDIKNQNGSSTRAETELHFQKYENLLSEKFSHQELNSSLLTFKPSIGLALTQNTLEYNLFYQYVDGYCYTYDSLQNWHKSFGPYSASINDIYNYVTVPIAQNVNEEVFANRSINFNYNQTWFDATGFIYNTSLNRMKQDHLDFKEFVFENYIEYRGGLEEYYQKEVLELNKILSPGGLQGSPIDIKYRLPNGMLTSDNNNIPSYYFKVISEYEPEPLPNPNQE